MGETVEIFLGFDPGGKMEGGKFGWSICQTNRGIFPLSGSGIETGVAKYAEDAIKQVSDNLMSNASVLAAGIDAPMFWSVTGEERQIDAVIKAAVKKAAETQGSIKGPGRKRPGVQHINQLAGACLVQGILLGNSLYQQFKVPITEVHPGALSWLQPATFDCIHRLTVRGKKSEHERDATLAAYAAWRMHQHLQGQMNGWRDLVERKFNYVTPLLPKEARIGYWMPIPRNNRPC